MIGPITVTIHVDPLAIERLRRSFEILAEETRRAMHRFERFLETIPEARRLERRQRAHAIRQQNLQSRRKK